MRGKSRARLYWASLVLLLLGSVLYTSLRPRDDAGPEGFLALRRFIEGIGVPVTSADSLPSSGALVLLDDLRTGREAKAVVEWVRSGGFLVTMQPDSETVQLMDFATTRQVGTFSESLDLSMDCILPETMGVRTIVVRGADELLSTRNFEAVTCLHRGGSGYLSALDVGKGRVIILGGRSVFSNQFLREQDNSALAYGLFEGMSQVTFGTALPANIRDKTAWQLLPLSAKLVLAQLSIGAILLAVLRGRRFGTPILEEPPVVIPAGELVRASASLYRNSGATEFAGRVLRRAFTRRLGRRFGIGPGDREALARIIHSSAHVDFDEVQSLLAGPDLRTDEELIHLGRGLEKLEKEILRSS